MDGAAPRPPAVRLTDIDKRYSGAHALRGVSLTVESGDVHAVAGENGAGKSTLMKILPGVIGADEYTGSLEIDGVARRFSSIRDAERRGVFLVPQELNIVPELRVGEYLYLSREPQRWGMVDTAKLWCDTAHWLGVFKLHCSPLAPMGELSTHKQQLVSIGRAMTQGVRVLILDEPTASLTERETELLFERIEDLHRHGVTTLYISHRLQEFVRIANAVTVMRDGSVVDRFRMDGATEVPRRIIRAMVGRELSDMLPKRPAEPGPATLSVRPWSVASSRPGRPQVVDGVDLDMRAGEVVGLFGLLGSGASDFARSLFGIDAGRASGSLTLRGQPVRVCSPEEAVAHGIAVRTAALRDRRQPAGGALGRHQYPHACLVRVRRHGASLWAGRAGAGGAVGQCAAECGAGAGAERDRRGGHRRHQPDGRAGYSGRSRAGRAVDGKPIQRDEPHEPALGRSVDHGRAGAAVRCLRGPARQGSKCYRMKHGTGRAAQPVRGDAAEDQERVRLADPLARLFAKTEFSTMTETA